MDTLLRNKFYLPICFLILNCSEIQAQQDSIRFKDDTYYKTDTFELCIFSKGGSFRYKANKFYSNYKLKINVAPDTCFYLLVYLHKYSHGKANYLFVDSHYRIVAEERVNVTSSTRHYNTTFVHKHKMIFHFKTLYGVSTKNYIFKIYKEVWHPPKF